jgi:hypothetical protein
MVCSKCVGIALDELRALPGVEWIDVQLVPFGVSLVTVGPLDGATARQVGDGLRRVGFGVVSRRTRKGHRSASTPGLRPVRA